MNNQKFQKPPIVNNIKNLASLFANKTRVFFLKWQIEQTLTLEEPKPSYILFSLCI